MLNKKKRRKKMENFINCTLYIDESGDLGVCRGTQWFVLSGVIVDNTDEPSIRNTLTQIKSKLNLNDVHLKRINDYYKRAYIAKCLNSENFTYINIIADTSKFDRSKIPSSNTAYNYICKFLLERVSWFLRDTNRKANIVLSSRGTSRDGELKDYIKNKLLPSPENNICSSVFDNISAKPAGSWDMLQLADVCATTMFLSFEKNWLGFTTPCYSRMLKKHLYNYNGQIENYGIKYFTNDMKPNIEQIKRSWVCSNK